MQQAVYDACDRDGGDDTSAGQPWVGTGTDITDPALETWRRKQGLAPHCRMFTSSLLATCVTVAAGSGIAVLPCYVGDADKRLRRLGQPGPELASDLWLLVHPELKRIAPIKAFNDYVFAAAHERLPQPSSF